MNAFLERERFQVDQKTIQVIAVIFSTILLGVGSFSVTKNRVRAGTAALTAMLALLILASVSQFKHVKGFGFEAETWSEKQQEAAHLIDKLKALTVASTKQLAMLGSSSGLLSNGPSPEALGEQLETTRFLLDSVETTTQERASILGILREGVKDAYLRQESALVGEYTNRLVTDPKRASEYNELLAETRKLDAGDWSSPAFVHQYKTLADKKDLMPDEIKARIRNLDEDLSFFLEHDKVRKR